MHRRPVYTEVPVLGPLLLTPAPDADQWYVAGGVVQLMAQPPAAYDATTPQANNGMGQARHRVLVLEVDAAAHQVRLLVNGKPCTVKVTPRAAELLHITGRDAATGPVVAEVKAPMPGLIRALHVQPGSAVAAGQPLLVLEAMKMENILKSPASGTVAQVLVQQGQSVDKGQVLVRFEG